jgi:hypothetical protein
MPVGEDRMCGRGESCGIQKHLDEKNIYSPANGFLGATSATPEMLRGAQ